MNTQLITKKYQIGNVNIELSMPENIKTPKNLSLFEKKIFSPEEKYVSYEVEFTNQIDKVIKELYEKKDEGKDITRPDLYLFKIDDRECRVLYLKGQQWPYAVCLEEADKNHVWVNEIARELLRYDTIFYSLFCLERYMIKTEGLILHCAYMCYKGKAVLFSAPSETGKSTQASLWEQYRQSRTINGDRALLLKNNDRWETFGWPLSGDSGICVNEHYPIEAIVMLKQAKENRVYPLSAGRAFQELFAQITVNGWNRDFQIKSMDLLEDLIKRVPVYRLECDISEHAVDCLEAILNF